MLVRLTQAERRSNAVRIPDFHFRAEKFRPPPLTSLSPPPTTKGPVGFLRNWSLSYGNGLSTSSSKVVQLTTEFEMEMILLLDPVCPRNRRHHSVLHYTQHIRQGTHQPPHIGAQWCVWRYI